MVDRSGDDLQEKEQDLERVAGDVETVRDTRLELGGTSDGADAVEAAMEAARDVTESVFETEDADLEGVQEGADALGRELDEHSESDSKDMEKVGSAEGKVTTNETANELAKVHAELRKGIEFLREAADRAAAAKDASEKAHARLQAIARGSGSGG